MTIVNSARRSGEAGA